mgnify:CR=1 FL=1
MTYCEGQPKTTEDSKSSVVFISDTVNNKIDVKINGALFTSYISLTIVPFFSPLRVLITRLDKSLPSK